MEGAWVGLVEGLVAGVVSGVTDVLKRFFTFQMKNILIYVKYRVEILNCNCLKSVQHTEIFNFSSNPKTWLQ